MKKQLLLTLGSIGLALATQATAVTFDFQVSPPNQVLTSPHTFTEGTLSITASGFATAGGTSDLYSKFTSGNPDETGLGMANDGDHEIDTTHFIQLDFSAVSPASSVSITISSIQGSPDPDETAVVYATKTPGSLVGATKIATLDGTIGGLVQPVNVTAYVNAGYFIDVTSSAGNVLIETVSVEPGLPLTGGDTATIGFWHNKNGQALIKSLNGGPAAIKLGNWLAANFGCLFGNLNGKPNTVVAAQFLTYFNVTGQKTYAQIMAVALASYATSSSLAGGTTAASYGFNVSTGGTGAKLFNVGPYGSAIGLLNNTYYSVMDLLEAANADCSGGVINPAAFNALNSIFDGINTGGDI